MSSNPFNIVDVPCEQLEAHLKFRVAKQGSAFRLSRTVEWSEELACCELITELFISFEGEKYRCDNFYKFFNMTGFEPGFEGLNNARRRFKLIEGYKRLPGKVAKILIDASGSSSNVFIRCHYSPDVYCWTTDVAVYLRANDLLKVLPETFGLFEMFDESNNWYLEVSDDDAFIFVVAAKSVIAQLVADGNYAIELPSFCSRDD